VLQLVSEQVGPSGQVVELRSVVLQFNTKAHYKVMNERRGKS